MGPLGCLSSLSTSALRTTAHSRSEQAYSFYCRNGYAFLTGLHDLRIPYWLALEGKTTHRVITAEWTNWAG